LNAVAASLIRLKLHTVEALLTALEDSPNASNEWTVETLDAIEDRLNEAKEALANL
jgi:hypothetical protein